MKKHRVLKTLAIIVAALVLFWTVINVIPPAKNVEVNPFVVASGELPMIAAHRGGGDCFPENTLLAFREAVNTYDVQILESDLYLTRDGHLVYNHDGYIDRTCNVNGDISLEEVKELTRDKANRHYISDMTLAELQQYNFGYYFTDENGERIYKDETDLEGSGLQIATVEQLFETFYQTHPELLFIVEIKNEGEAGREACRILSETLEQYPAFRNRIVVGTFHDEIEVVLKEEFPDLLRGAPVMTAAKFVLTQLLGVNLFNPSDFACLQIPTSYDLGTGEITLTFQTIIDRAHRRNIAVQYWTINDAPTMRQLIEMGCDCIMTDNPKLLRSVLNEYR